MGQNAGGGAENVGGEGAKQSRASRRSPGLPTHPSPPPQHRQLEHQSHSSRTSLKYRPALPKMSTIGSRLTFDREVSCVPPNLLLPSNWKPPAEQPRGKRNHKLNCSCRSGGQIPPRPDPACGASCVRSPSRCVRLACGSSRWCHTLPGAPLPPQVRLRPGETGQGEIPGNVGSWASFSILSSGTNYPLTGPALAPWPPLFPRGEAFPGKGWGGGGILWATFPAHLCLRPLQGLSDAGPQGARLHFLLRTAAVQFEYPRNRTGLLGGGKVTGAGA